MKKIFQFIALLLLALWLPVTEHCEMEAAGIELSASCEHGSAVCETSCAHDLCGNLKEASVSGAGSMVRAMPALVCTLNDCLLQLLQPPRLAENVVCMVEYPPEVQVLHRTWQFVRRSALPARAPDYVA